MAKNTTKTAKADTATRYWDAKKAKTEEVRKEFPFAMHNCEMLSDRKSGGEVVIPKGSTVKCIWIGANKFLRGQAIVLYKGDQFFVEPKMLKKGKPMDKGEVARLEAEREEASSATVLVYGEVRKQTDKGILLAYPGWMKNLFFTTTMVAKRDGTFPYVRGKDTLNLDIYEVPQWKVKQEVGQDALDALLAKQADIAKHLPD